MGQSKKDKRDRNKKRKVEAYLRLAEENDAERSSQKPKFQDDGSSSGDSSDLERKRKSSKRRIKKEKHHTDVGETCSASEPKALVEKPTDAGMKKEKCHTDIEETCSASEPKAHVEKKCTDAELKALRVLTIARKQKAMERPKVFLRREFSSQNLVPAPVIRHPLAKDEDGCDSDDDYTSPLFTIDMQHLLLFCIEGNLTSYKPRFCSLLRSSRVNQVVVIVANGLSLSNYQDNKESFPFLNEHFAIKVPLVSPTQYGSSVAEELLNVPLSESQILSMRKQSEGPSAHKRVLAALHMKLVEEKTLIPVVVKHNEHQGTQPTTTSTETTSDDNTQIKELSSVKDVQEDPYLISRFDLLLSPLQMIHGGYILPAPAGYFKDFVTTKEKYKHVTPNSPMFAIDCEMCATVGSRSELTWIAVVNEALEVVYESLVKPRNRITDYLTRFSGVTRGMLENVTTRIDDVHNALREILPGDAILCGQSFNCDLKAMKMFHPYVIDTSVIFNLSGMRHYKPSLRLLAFEFLNETIQAGGNKGHSPVEDACTTMRLVQHKLSYADVRYGDIILHNAAIAASKRVTNGDASVKESVTTEEECGSDTAVKRIFFKRPGTSLTQSFFSITKKCNKSALFVDRAAEAAPYKDEVDACHITESDRETLSIVKDHMANYMMAWVQLHGASGFKEADEQSQQKMLKKTDKHIRKLVSRVADKSMVVVIFPGQSEENDSADDALGCIHIINKPT